MTAYFPDSATVRAVAVGADFAMGKIDDPPNDWSARSVLSVPGPVWTVSSDTCMTGRLNAPDNIAYDHFGREFVSLQPRDAKELEAVMSADSEEVFGCYRFDGLKRWTTPEVTAWTEDRHLLARYAEVSARTETGEIADVLGNYADYLVSGDLKEYLAELTRHLDEMSALDA